MVNMYGLATRNGTRHKVNVDNSGEKLLQHARAADIARKSCPDSQAGKETGKNVWSTIFLYSIS